MSKYNIPALDSLVVGHADPDGDSLSSIKAVLNHIRKQGKKAFAKVSGKIPDHLAWILSEEDLKEIPKFEQTIVLDCAPSQERTGFTIDGPIFNIDHHSSRKKEHNTKNNIYVLDRCSTASALILDFNIIDDILLVGLFGDTMFSISWNELQKCFKKIKISDEHAHNLLSSCRPTRDRKALHVVQTAKLHRCRNGFMIAETEEKDQTVISEVMETLFRYSEGVCLIDGANKVRLRTSNDSVDVGAIAKTFSGGGSKNASGIPNINGKRKTLIAVIKQLNIEPNHYEE